MYPVVSKILTIPLDYFYNVIILVTYCTIPKPLLDWKPGQQESIYACYFLILNPGWTQNFSKYYSESIIKEW